MIDRADWAAAAITPCASSMITLPVTSLAVIIFVAVACIVVRGRGFIFTLIMMVLLVVITVGVVVITVGVVVITVGVVVIILVMLTGAWQTGSWHAAGLALKHGEARGQLDFPRLDVGSTCPPAP